MSIDTTSLMFYNHRPAPVFVRGEGSWLWDSQGRQYLDFIQGWAVNALGHCPAVVADALATQSRQLIIPSPTSNNEPSARLARRLTEHSVFDRVFFVNSGAEANEGAIKLARRWGHRHRSGAFEIITFHHAFHGRTLATMSASGKPAFATLFEPKVAGFPKATLNDLDSVRKLINQNTVAVMLEPIQGEAGVIDTSLPFLQNLRQLTQENGLLLIVDEIQTGVGRTGKRWAYEHAGIKPDMMTLGKGIGGGVPLSALLATESVACFEPGDQGSTFGGNPLMTAVGDAVVAEVFKPALLERVNVAAQRFQQGLQQLSDEFNLGGTRGRGLLLALDLRRPIGAAVVEQARELGLLLNSPRSDTLRFMPSLNVTDAEIDQMLSILRGVLQRAT